MIICQKKHTMMRRPRLTALDSSKLAEDIGTPRNPAIDSSSLVLGLSRGYPYGQICPLSLTRLLNDPLRRKEFNNSPSSYAHVFASAPDKGGK